MNFEGRPRLPESPAKDESKKSAPSNKGVSRRDMLKYIGAGLAGAAISSGTTEFLKDENDQKENQESIKLDLLQEYAASKLSQMEIPDFSSNYDNVEASGRVVAQSFREVAFTDPENAEKWMNHFSDKIHQFSEGKVSLQKATDQEIPQFNTRLRGPAKYMFLSSENETKRIIFSPSANPFIFDSE